MSVKEARKILGSDSLTMSDEDVEEMISTLTEMARMALDVAKDHLLTKKYSNE